LGLARRAGRVAIGTRAVRAAAQKGVLEVLVLATDASDNALARLGTIAEKAVLVRCGSRLTLGRAVGRGEVAVVGITDRALARRLLKEQEAPEGCDSPGAGEDPRRQVP